MIAILRTLSLLLAATTVVAQTVLPPFDAAYSAVDLGSVPGAAAYGGLAFRPGAADTLLFGEFDARRLVTVPVRRGASGHIAGFGTPTPFATVDGPDGGLAVGPGGVLFATAYGVHTLQQLKPGSATVDRTIDLGARGVPASVGACVLPPAGHPAAGRLKLLTYGSAAWVDATLVADGTGTWSLQQIGAPIWLPSGAEGALYPPTGLPMLTDHRTVLIAEWDLGAIALYDTDANGDPLPGTRRTLVANVPACAGGAVDPATGDMLFSFGTGHVVAIRNVASPCGSFASYGAGAGGAFGTPVLAGQGCARIGQRITLTVTGGRPNAPGVLNVGTFATAVPVFGILVLTDPLVAIDHVLDGTGAFTLPLTLPPDPVVAANDFFFQAIQLDPSLPFGLAATAGLRLDAR